MWKVGGIEAGKTALRAMTCLPSWGSLPGGATFSWALELDMPVCEVFMNTQSQALQRDGEVVGHYSVRLWVSAGEYHQALSPEGLGQQGNGTSEFGQVGFASQPGKCHINRFWIHIVLGSNPHLTLVNWTTSGKVNILVLQFSYLWNGIIMELTQRVLKIGWANNIKYLGGEKCLEHNPIMCSVNVRRCYYYCLHHHHHCFGWHALWFSLFVKSG